MDDIARLDVDQADLPVLGPANQQLQAAVLILQRLQRLRVADIHAA